MKIEREIKRAREARHWTQVELAAKADVDPSLVSRVERGFRVSLTTYEKLCAALDLKLSISVSDRRAA